MNITAIIQARMSSRRLPGKVLMDLAGKPVLQHVVERVSQCNSVNQIVVATSSDVSDDPISIWCKKNNIDIYRGSMNNVLQRYYLASKQYNASSVLRITADCPVLDPDVIDELIQFYSVNDFDACGLAGHFPDGLDCTIISRTSLQLANANARLPSELEHVCPYIENNPALFRFGKFYKFSDASLSSLRLTLDEIDDYKLLKIIFTEFDSNPKFRIADILSFLKANPSLTMINQHIIRNEGLLRSIALDPC